MLPFCRQLFRWVRLRKCGCLVTWFCYQLIAKPGNKRAAVPWLDPYASSWLKIFIFSWKFHWNLFPWNMLQLISIDWISIITLPNLIVHTCVSRPHYVHSLRQSDACMCYWFRPSLVQMMFQPDRRLTIIWTNVHTLLGRPFRNEFREICIKIQQFSYKKVKVKKPSAKWCQFCLGCNKLTLVDWRVGTFYVANYHYR